MEWQEDFHKNESCTDALKELLADKMQLASMEQACKILISQMDAQNSFLDERYDKIRRRYKRLFERAAFLYVTKENM